MIYPTFEKFNKTSGNILKESVILKLLDLSKYKYCEFPLYFALRGTFSNKIFIVLKDLNKELYGIN
jgi:hypothetical protein